MRFSGICTLIAMALEHEASTRELELKMVMRLAPLQRSPSSLPADVEHLMGFIRAYISHVPRLMQALEETARTCGLSMRIAPLLDLMEDFLLQGSAQIPDQRRLAEILDESYLVHRLIDNINQGYQERFGAPLVELNMTSANLIVHALIGEPFATELDTLAKDAACGLLPATCSVGQPLYRSWTAQWLRCTQFYQLTHLQPEQSLIWCVPAGQ